MWCISKSSITDIRTYKLWISSINITNLQVVLPSEIAFKLSGQSQCLDSNWGAGYKVTPYGCHYGGNQRWKVDQRTGQIIEVQRGNWCWDIDGMIAMVVKANQFQQCQVSSGLNASSSVGRTIEFKFSYLILGTSVGLWAGIQSIGDSVPETPPRLECWSH